MVSLMYPGYLEKDLVTRKNFIFYMKEYFNKFIGMETSFLVIDSLEGINSTVELIPRRNKFLLRD
jgi:hypothetical protein